MKRSKFSEGQIAYILRQGEEGVAVEDVCRKAGISLQTYYRWRKKYGGLMPSEMKLVKLLEEENSRLKELVADLSLDKAMLQDVLSRNVWSAPSLQGFLEQLGDRQLRKCIRPLASGLLLQPGHDEIHTHRSHKAGSGTKPAFDDGLTVR